MEIRLLGDLGALRLLGKGRNLSDNSCCHLDVQLVQDFMDNSNDTYVPLYNLPD